MSETNAERLRRLRAIAVAEGKCLVCRLRKPRKHNKVCDDCLDRSHDQAKAYKAQGLCACGNKRLPDRETCKGCTKSKRAAGQRAVEKARATRKCISCRWRIPKPGQVTCAHCVSRINELGAKRAEENRSAKRCYCGRERRPGHVQCWKHSLYFQLYAARRALAAPTVIVPDRVAQLEARIDRIERHIRRLR